MTAAQQYCFLHVGKTGGSTIKTLLSAHKRRHPAAPIRAFKHDVNLARIRDEYPDYQVIFFVRDPVERFVSGFNSRLRQGLPRNNNPWTPAEIPVFRRFPTANALAESIGSPEASAAMQDIGHLRNSLVYFLGSIELLETMSSRICFIGHLAHFDNDLAALRRLLHIDPDLVAPTDDVGTHRTPSHMNTCLSDLGQQNLRAWYAKDYPIYKWCQQARETILRR